MGAVRVFDLVFLPQFISHVRFVHIVNGSLRMYVKDLYR